MDYRRKIRCISNSYYNLSLEFAGSRDLTAAADVLKTSLRFNKYNTNARNLLGLIYYETGEVADALVQWVISLNLEPNENRAERYLSELQGRFGALDTADQMIRKYNQALDYAQDGNYDLAILQLTRVVDKMPNYVKAQLLLVLLYIFQGEYTKAGKWLSRVLEIDKNNPKARWYMTIVKENTGRAEIEKQKLANAFSHRQMQDDDIIIPPTYQENTGWQTVINLIVGLFIGVLVISFLVLPANNRLLNGRHNQEMIRYSESINQKSLEIDDLNRALQTAKKAQDKAEESLNDMVGNNDYVLSQYRMITLILEAYQKENLAEAAQWYVQMDCSILHDGVLDSIVDNIQKDMEANGYRVLQELGDKAVTGNNLRQAITYYEQSVFIRQANPQVLYQLGRLYKRLDDTDKANEYFGQVIMNYANTEYADLAKEERGY